jgi:hypothetical protein
MLSSICICSLVMNFFHEPLLCSSSRRQGPGFMAKLEAAVLHLRTLSTNSELHATVCSSSECVDIMILALKHILNMLFKDSCYIKWFFNHRVFPLTFYKFYSGYLTMLSFLPNGEGFFYRVAQLCEKYIL